jgi:hypothetical protein
LREGNDKVIWKLGQEGFSFITIYFFSANARSSGYSLKRGKMIRFIGKADQKPYNKK